MNRDNIYSDADEKYVKNTIVYSRTAGYELNLFYDRKHTKGISKDELFNLFLKGMTIYSDADGGANGAYIKPTIYEDHDDYSLVKANGYLVGSSIEYEIDND